MAVLKEFFESLVSHAQKGFRPQILDCNREPGHRYAIAHADERLEWREAYPSPRGHKASDLTAIVQLAREAHTVNPVIWFSRSGVVLFLDDSTRRDVVRLQLEFHPQLKTLIQCEAKKEWRDHKGFVSFLRIELNGCLADSDGLLEVIRRVRFKKLESGESVLAHTKASIGRSLECELTGSGPIPEQVLVSVPIFAGPGSHIGQVIRCAIEVDAGQEKFLLLPFPGEIEQAICQAEATVGRELTEQLGAGVPVYYGNP